MDNKGSALLITTIVVTSILLVIGLTLGAVSFGELNISNNDRKARQALSMAEAGARDGLVMVTRNKNFQSPGYVLQLSGGSATITVERNQPISGKTTIISSSQVDDVKKRIKVIVSVDNDGKVVQDSWQEEEVP